MRAWGSSEGWIDIGVLPEEPGLGQVLHKEEDRESKTSHFVSCAGPDSIVSSSSSLPFLFLLRLLNIWSLPFARCYRPRQILGKSVPDIENSKGEGPDGSVSAVSEEQRCGQ